jgi:antitoxin CptB
MAGGDGQDRARLAWRCRRGTKELDLLLLGWLARHFDSATVEQRARFAALLELPDPELARYLLKANHPLAVDLGDEPGAEPSPERPI